MIKLYCRVFSLEERNHFILGPFKQTVVAIFQENGIF